MPVYQQNYPQHKMVTADFAPTEFAPKLTRLAIKCLKGQHAHDETKPHKTYLFLVL